MQAKCVLCETRPAKTVDGYCLQCKQKLDHAANKVTKQQARYYIHWRGYVMALYQDEPDHYVGRLENLSLEDLPKFRVLNIDTYLSGYTRDQIKKFKRDILSLASGSGKLQK